MSEFASQIITEFDPTHEPYNELLTNFQFSDKRLTAAEGRFMTIMGMKL